MFSTAYSQDPGVLFVNKTSCSISAVAGCGNCDLQNIGISDFQIIPADGYLLFEESSAPGLGCVGSFALFRFAFPPYDVYQNITFDPNNPAAYNPNDPNESCVPDPVCDPDFAPYQWTIFQSEYQCLQGDVKITGVYHDHINAPTGSHCHVVAEMQ